MSARRRHHWILYATVLATSSAWADPPDAVPVTATGLWLTTADRASSAAPGCATPDGARLVARDGSAGWAVVQFPLEDSASVRFIADALPLVGSRVHVVAGAARYDGAVERASVRSLSVRLDAEPRDVTRAAVFDDDGRLLALVLRASGTLLDAVPAQLALGDVRDADAHGIPACPGAPRGVILRPSVTPPRCEGPPRGALSDDLRRRAFAATVTAGAHRGVALDGDGFVALAASAVPDTLRGCPVALDDARATLRTVDATTGLALLRAPARAASQTLALRADAPDGCTALFAVLDAQTAVPLRVVRAEGARLSLRASPSTVWPASLEGLPLVDDRGCLVAMLRRVSGADVEATTLTALADALAHDDPRAGPSCASDRAMPDAQRAPSIPPDAVVPVDPEGRAVAVHLASDAVYATTADRLRDMASGCVVRRRATRDGRPLAGEVLDVNPAANLALYRLVAAESDAVPPRDEGPPLVIASTRPTAGARVFLATVPYATQVARGATVREASADELWLDLDAGEASVPEGSPVLDGGARVLGVVDRTVFEAGVVRAHARAAPLLRPRLAALHREQATPTCFPTYGAPQGNVVAVTATAGLGLGTEDAQGLVTALAVGALWFNTWYAHGELGTRLTPAPMLRLAVGGGPVLFRSPGDGEVGVGLRLEVEPELGSSRTAVTSPGAQRFLFGAEVQGAPYLSERLGLTFSLALGVAQYGSFDESHFAFGGTFQLGLMFGLTRLRHDR